MTIGRGETVGGGEDPVMPAEAGIHRPEGMVRAPTVGRVPG